LDRQKLVEIAYQKGNQLNLSNQNYRDWLDSFFAKEYTDDVEPGDITSRAVLIKNELRTAFLIVKAPGIIAGLEEVNWFLQKHSLRVKHLKKDGQKVLKGERILEIQGKQKDILATERIALNVVQRMSGIATETKHLIDSLKVNSAKVVATRKTLLRYFDKKAVFLGGGLTHRFGLWDSILIKDNHLEIIKSEGKSDYLETALNRVSTFADNVGFIEIEVTSHEEAIRAAKKFKNLHLKIPCIIMLDNMMPSEIEQTIDILIDKNLYNSVILEASGKITPKNIGEYAKTGVDVVSLGYLTHSAKVLDISLELMI
jgi:nicotinate-nucleotide pyrophosphorylase (carboxylating)